MITYNMSKAYVVYCLGCWSAEPEGMDTNPFKSKHNFASVMLTEIIS